MRKEVYTYPKSGFLSAEKDMNLIVSMILKNDRLKKMLYYTNRNCLNEPKLTEDQSLELFGTILIFFPNNSKLWSSVSFGSFKQFLLV